MPLSMKVGFMKVQVFTDMYGLINYPLYILLKMAYLLIVLFQNRQLLYIQKLRSITNLLLIHSIL